VAAKQRAGCDFTRFHGLRIRWTKRLNMAFPGASIWLTRYKSLRSNHLQRKQGHYAVAGDANRHGLTLTNESPKSP
jgi:hypothetical protein